MFSKKKKVWMLRDTFKAIPPRLQSKIKQDGNHEVGYYIATTGTWDKVRRYFIQNNLTEDFNAIRHQI